MEHRCSMSPACVAPISRTSTSVRGSAERTVRGNPSSLFKLPSVAETRFPACLRMVARASLVVVFPTVPVMPTTMGEGASGRTSVHLASLCSAFSGSSTTRVGTSRGRVATVATAPRRCASGAKSAPSVRPRRAKNRSPSRTLRESIAAPPTMVFGVGGREIRSHGACGFCKRGRPHQSGSSAWKPRRSGGTLK